MSKWRFRIGHWIVAWLRALNTSNAAGSSEVVTIYPEAVPSIVPHEDPNQPPGHGEEVRLGRTGQDNGQDTKKRR